MRDMPDWNAIAIDHYEPTDSFVALDLLEGFLHKCHLAHTSQLC